MFEAALGSQAPLVKTYFYGQVPMKTACENMPIFMGGSLKLRAILYKETKKYSFHMKSNDTKLYIKIITLNEM